MSGQEDVSSVIEELYDKYSFTTQEIAKLCGLRKESIRRWRRGAKAPKLAARDLKRLQRIAAILGGDGGLPPESIRPWFMTRAAYLSDERPGALLPERYYAVRDYAMAYLENGESIPGLGVTTEYGAWR